MCSYKYSIALLNLHSNGLAYTISRVRKIHAMLKDWSCKIISVPTCPHTHKLTPDCSCLSLYILTLCSPHIKAPCFQSHYQQHNFQMDPENGLTLNLL